MCGIYSTNLHLDEGQVKEKIENIKFRGPDHTGYLKTNGISFGHLRLSIIDLDERSNQPMQFGKYTIVYNGEIYNYKDVRQELITLGCDFETESDTEVILKGYALWGKDVVPKLNGMFSFVIHDAALNNLFCSRDRLGVKPFYYYWKDGYFEICSQLRPIVCDKSLEINDEAVSLYLDLKYIPSPYTIFNDVYKLRPGNSLEVNLNTKEIQISEYWNLKKSEYSDIGYDQAKDELHNLLKDAVRIRLNSDVPIGCFLSGGIDSSLITSIAQKLSDNPIKTFSIGFDNPKYDESKVAAKYAEIIKSDHTETICTPEDVLQMLPHLINAYDEPFADSSALPSLLLNNKTKNYVTVALSGDGGDESFLGYNHFDAVSKFEKISYVPYLLRKFISLMWIGNTGERKKAYKLSLKIRNVNDYIVRVFAGLDSVLQDRKKSIKPIKKMYGYSLRLSKNVVQRLADFNIKLWLENASNVKVDRASMAFSVEVRSPLLDYRIVEFARTLPVKYRFQRGVKKRILRDILKEYIPEEVFNQPKMGFSVPLDDWIRNELKEEILGNLSDDFLAIVPNLNVSKFKKMLKLHMSGKHDYTLHIWRVFVLSKWYQEFGYYKTNS